MVWMKITIFRLFGTRHIQGSSGSPWSNHAKNLHEMSYVTFDKPWSTDFDGPTSSSTWLIG